MKYRYIVAQSDDAVSRIDRATHVLSHQDVLRQYGRVGTVIQLFFAKRNGVRAQWQELPGRNAIEIAIETGGTQDDADHLLQAFLRFWNSMTEGLGVVMKEKFPAA